MFNFPEMAKAARALPFRGIRTYLRSFDPSFPCPKLLQLWGSCHWLKHLRRNKPFDNKVAEGTYQVTADGHVCGGSGLADTAIYPRAFGEAVSALASSSFKLRHHLRFKQIVLLCFSKVAQAYLENSQRQSLLEDLQGIVTMWDTTRQNFFPDSSLFSWIGFT